MVIIRLASPRVSVRPLPIVHFGPAVAVSGGGSHKFALLVKVMPALPTEMPLPAARRLVRTFTATTGLETRMPPQVTAPPRVLVQLAAVATVASHVATSPEPGAVPATQLVPRFSASLLLVLKICAGAARVAMTTIITSADPVIFFTFIFFSWIGDFRSLKTAGYWFGKTSVTLFMVMSLYFIVATWPSANPTSDLPLCRTVNVSCNLVTLPEPSTAYGAHRASLAMLPPPGGASLGVVRVGSSTSMAFPVGRFTMDNLK